MKGLCGLALLLALAAPSAARDVEVAAGEVIPNIRPCVDIVAEGDLHSTGDPLAIYDPDDLLGHSIYSYRFTPDRTLVGKEIRRSIDLRRAAHAPRKVDVEDALVFYSIKQGNRVFVDWEWVWQDRRGRRFVPVFDRPDAEYRNVDWRPLAVRDLIKPVAYAPHQPYWDDVELSEDDLEPGVIEKRGHRYVVLSGIYLSDIARAFEAAKQEDCWR